MDKKNINISKKIFQLFFIILIISFLLLCYVLFDQPFGKLFLDQELGFNQTGFVTICSFVIVMIMACFT